MLPKIMVTDKIDESKKMKEMCADRKGIVAQMTEYKNQLHTILHKIFGDEYETTVSYKDIFCIKAIQEWKKILDTDKDYLNKRALLKITQMEISNNELKLINDEIKRIERTNEDIQLLVSIPGCGIVSACEIMGEIKDIERFASSAKLAKYSALAPRNHSSGSKTRHYTDKRGNRILNRSIFQIAFTQIGKQGTEKSRKYYKKKVQEGKSKMHAIRCLKRQLVDVIYRVLKSRKTYSMLEDSLVKTL